MRGYRDMGVAARTNFAVVVAIIGDEFTGLNAIVGSGSLIFLKLKGKRTKFDRESGKWEDRRKTLCREARSLILESVEAGATDPSGSSQNIVVGDWEEVATVN